MRKTLLKICALVTAALLTAMPVHAEDASAPGGKADTETVSAGTRQTEPAPVRTSPAKKHRRLIAGPHFVARGKKIRLSLKYSENGVEWKSSSKRIASVDADGTVHGKKDGKAVITATENGKSYKWKVIVAKPRLRAKHIVFYGGRRKTRLWLKNAGDYGKTAVWRSSNPSVATVSPGGTVKSRKRGTCTITASIGGTELTCEVRVGKKQGQKILRAW